MKRPVLLIQQITLVAASSLLLAACGGDEHQDLKLWMKEQAKDMKGRVPPLPEIKPFPIVDYIAGDLVDPFRPSRIEPEKPKPCTGGAAGSQDGSKKQCKGPDLNRPREPLEGFTLESLKMVGTLQQDKMMYAIILAGGSVYRVKIGNYMGQNFGIISNITESEVQLKELVQDATGDWVENTSTLQLQELEGKK